MTSQHCGVLALPLSFSSEGCTHFCCPLQYFFPSEAMAANYPARLSEHLRELSREKEDDLSMYMEWYFKKIEDTGAPVHYCPCGYQGIRYKCFIENKFTRQSTFVGTRCGELFDEDMREVLQLVHGLIRLGIRGKYKGFSKTKKHRFEIEENEGLATKSEFLRSHLEFVPVYQKGNGAWEVQVFFEDFLGTPVLEEDNFYKLRIKSSRWETEHGTGVTFRVIQYSAD